MLSRFTVHRIAAALRKGAVIAYPTETVFGLGCLPSLPQAVHRVLELKQRDAAKGLILLSANTDLLAGWIDAEDPTALTSSATQPVTWVVPAGPRAYPALTGGRSTIAVRITDHAVAAALSRAVGEPLVSTSANLSGRAPLTDARKLRAEFGGRVDLIVPGALGASGVPSEIRDLATGRVLRSARIIGNDE